MSDDPELYRILGRLEGKLDAALATQARHESEIRKIVERITHLEKGRAFLVGIATIISFSIPLAVEYLLA